MIYAEFNSNLVPRDLGPERTILGSVDIFWTKLTKSLSADPALLSGWQEEDKASLMPRLQTALFWLVYFQRSHTSAKTWFANTKRTEPLAAAVLEPTAEFSASMVKEIILSPFVESDKVCHFISPLQDRSQQPLFIFKASLLLLFEHSTNLYNLVHQQTTIHPSPIRSDPLRQPIQL